MQKQEMLEFINKTWPLGIDYHNSVPVLLLQKNEKYVPGIIVKTIKGYDDLFEINHYSFYRIINTSIFLILLKSFIENDYQKRQIALGRTLDGFPVIFSPDKKIYSFSNLSYSIHKIGIPVLIAKDKPYCFKKQITEDCIAEKPLVYSQDVIPQYDIVNNIKLDFLVLDNIIFFLNGFNFNNCCFNCSKSIIDLIDYINKNKPNKEDSRLIDLYERDLYDTFACELISFKRKFEDFIEPLSNILNTNKIQSFEIQLEHKRDLSNIENLFEKNKFWKVKKSSYNFSIEDEEIFPKGLMLNTDNTDKDRFLDFFPINGNIELNVFGIEKIRKVPFDCLEPIDSEFTLFDYSENIKIWSERDKILNKEVGSYDYFIIENDKVVRKQYFHDIYDIYVNRFFNHFIFNDYTQMKRDIKCLINPKSKTKSVMYTESRINEKDYTNIVKSLNPDSEILELTDTVCSFARFWNISCFDFSYDSKTEEFHQNVNNITKSIIKSLSLYGKISNEDSAALSKILRIYYLGFFVNEGNNEKAAIIKNLINVLPEYKSFDCYEIRKLIYDFRKLIGLEDYEEELNKNIGYFVNNICSYRLDSLSTTGKNDLLLNTRKNCISLLETIEQFPANKRLNVILKLNKCNDWVILYELMEISLGLLPETYKEQLSLFFEKLKS